ncbi:MAG: ACT domain-containing protein [Clostridia bacterium]|nr:ACT domain-containing protein [Clostridia bacterium]
MDGEKFLLIDSRVLPDVFEKVLEAKELLASGLAENTSKAVKMVGISRSAFYKYKNFVYKYDNSDNHTVNLEANLSDKAGVFSALTTSLYKYGANILTVHQGIPKDGIAEVSITIRTDDIKISLDSLLGKISDVSGVISIKAI